MAKAKQEYIGYPEARTSRRVSIKKLVIGLIVFIVAVSLPVLIYLWPLYKTYFEHEAPVIQSLVVPPAIGIAPTKLVLEVSDKVSGLDEVIIRHEKKNNSIDILRDRLWSQKLHNKEYELEFSGKDPNFKEAVAVIDVKVFDRAFWSNSTSKVFKLPIDIINPKVEPISAQHNGVQGGSELVIYKATDLNLESSGVVIRDQYYKGFL